MVVYSGLDKRVIWSHIKTLRFENLKKDITLKCDAIYTSYLIPLENIVQNLETILRKVRVENFHLNRNLTKHDVNLGAEMFIVLNSCPSIHEKLYWEVAYGPKSTVVLKALNIFKKAKDNFKLESLKIFSKITSMLQFKHISFKKSKKQSIVLEHQVVGIEGKSEKNVDRVLRRPPKFRHCSVLTQKGLLHGFLRYPSSPQSPFRDHKKSGR